jgi:DNA (cytosine-5)-methyltransferase 1
MRRIVADVAPSYIFAENVSRVAIDQAADDCESMGYKTKAVSLSAKDLGADHIRDRFWLFAYSNNDGEFPCQINAETRWMQNMDIGIWTDYPESLRVVNGVDCRMDRLKAVGNGQVPIVAATAWRILTER